MRARALESSARSPGNIPGAITAIRYDFLPHVVEKRTDLRERFARFVEPTLTQPLGGVAYALTQMGYRKRARAMSRNSRAPIGLALNLAGNPAQTIRDQKAKRPFRFSSTEKLGPLFSSLPPPLFARRSRL